MAIRNPLPWLGRVAAALALVPGLASAYPGLLDPAFGTGGLVQTRVAYSAFADSPPGASGIARQADGKLVVAGSTGVVSGTFGESRFGLVRYNPDGSVDATFGVQGRVNGGPAVGFANGLLIDGGGRIVVFGSALDLNTGNTRFALARFLSDGTPDATFGSGGLATASVGETSTIRAARLDASGRLIVAGSTSNQFGTAGAWAVARFDASGAIDATFGQAGVAVVGFNAVAESAYALAIDAQGRIVVTGNTATSGAGVARFLANGTLDSAFGTAGKMSAGSPGSRFNAVEIDASGRIVLAGWLGGATSQMVAARLTAAGALDATFGSGGIASAGFPTAFPLMSAAYGLALDANGRIFLAGEAGPSNPNTFAFARLNADGTPDATFGSAGRQSVLLAGSAGSATSGARGVVAGSGGTWHFAGFGLSRFTLGAIDGNGTAVPGFNAGNANAPVATPATAVSGLAGATWNALAVQADGKTIAAGGATPGAYPATTLVALTRRLANGSADATFGGTGELAVQTVDGSGAAKAVVIDGSGRIVVAGSTGVPGFTRFSVLRHLANGTRDAAFGANGEVATSFGLGESMANAVAVDANARLVVAGSWNDGAVKRLAIARYLDNGSLDTGFGSGGRVSVALPGNAAEILALRLDGAGRLVIAGRDIASGAALLARFTAAGALDATFGTGGIVSIAGTGARLHALAFDAANRIVAVGAADNGSGKLAPLFVRVTDTGQPATPQGGLGQLLALGTAPSELRGLAIDAQGRLLVGGHTAGRLLLARLDAATLAPDATYGANVGVTIVGGFSGSNPADSPRAGYGMAVQADGAVVLAGRDRDVSNADVGLLARFAIATPAGQNPLVVTKSGSGTVTSVAPGIACGDLCVADYAAGTLVTVNAAPAPGWRFDSWSGACAGTNSTCVVTMDVARSLRATFLEGAALPNGSRFANLATRMPVLTGNDVLIGGFILGGTQPRTVVVRARGPSLAGAGVAGVLPNPAIDLFAGQVLLESNDDWGASANAVPLSSSGFAPPLGNESAIYATLLPGAYTAVVSGVGGSTGNGIVEVFDTDPADGRLVNISTRGRVGTGENVMIAGFVIAGDQPQTVIIRARGPSLAQAGVTGPLANPLLQLFSGATQIAVNDNWASSPDAAAISAAGYAPANAFESAMRVTLSPGAYTAIVSGVSGATGVAIVEVFAQ